MENDNKQILWFLVHFFTGLLRPRGPQRPLTKEEVELYKKLKRKETITIVAIIALYFIVAIVIISICL